MRSVLPRLGASSVGQRTHSQYRCPAYAEEVVCLCAGYGGYYLTIVKKNQQQMYEYLADFFEDPDAEQEEWQYAKSVQKKHGRLELRELWSSTQMNEWFEPEWAGIAQAFRIRRFVKERDKQKGGEFSL